MKLLNKCIFIIIFFLPLSLLYQINDTIASENVGNRYGIDISHGPYSDQNLFCGTYCGQCTAFAWGRALDRLGVSIAFSQSSGRNACNWQNLVTNIGSNLSSVPRANSLAIWATDTCNLDNPGHIAYVEEVDGENIYINEANVDTYIGTNEGGYYDGYTKRFTATEITERGGAIGTLQGYLYLDSSFSDYWYWDFDNNGTEDWNAREALNQGIYNENYWQIGQSFENNTNKRGVVSPKLNQIHTDNYNGVEIKFGVNSRFLNHVDAYFKINDTWFGPESINWFSGSRSLGSQNVYRGNINHDGQIQQIRIDFDKGSDTENCRIFIDEIKFIKIIHSNNKSMPWLSLLLDTSTQPNQVTWYKDLDGDGYSDGISQVGSARPSKEYYMESELTAISGDNDDNDSTIYPQAPEICDDGKDNNQNGEIDEGCVSTGGVISLPKTGQTTCYDSSGNVIACAGTGQDGEAQTGVNWPEPRFTDNDDGTITDNLTGIIWLKNPSSISSMNWHDAVTFCNNLASGAYGLTDGSVGGDWRLPNFLELESLINLEELNTATWLDNQGFSFAHAAFWSATTDMWKKSDAFVLFVEVGSLGSRCNKAYSYQEVYSKYIYVWPVRNVNAAPAKIWQTGQTTCYNAENVVMDCDETGQDGDIQAGVEWPSPRFTDNNDGTVTDNLTGLIWLKDANAAGTITWSQALDFCNNLSSGSYGLTDGSVTGAWRLPNRKELLSLIDYSQYSPSVPQNNPFENIQSAHYWSASTGNQISNNKWCLHMRQGVVSFGYPMNQYYVWPVRDP